MRLQKVQEALNTKKIPFEYTEEDGCGSIVLCFQRAEVPRMGV